MRPDSTAQWRARGGQCGAYRHVWFRNDSRRSAAPDSGMAAEVPRLLDGCGRPAGTARGEGPGGGAPAHRPADRTVSLHRRGLDGRRGRAAQRGGAGPQRRRARRGRLRAGPPRLRLDPSGRTGPGRRGERRAEPGGGAAGARRTGAAAAGLPARAHSPEHRGLPGVRPRRVPPGARRSDRARRRAAALLHLAPPRVARAPGGRAGRGAARVLGVAADPGGAGLPGRYGPGADLPGGGGARTGGGQAACGGGAAVPAARRGAHLAGAAHRGPGAAAAAAS